jgi:hypothetical protein
MGERLSPLRVRTLLLIVEVINQSIRSLARSLLPFGPHAWHESPGLGCATLAAQKGDGSYFLGCAFRSFESCVSAIQTPAFCSPDAE